MSNHTLLAVLAACRRLGLRLRADRRGAVALFFVFTLIPVLITVDAAIDMSRLADGRANLQLAADNAAVSGAAAYSEGAAALNTLGMTIATTAFCDSSATIPEGFAVVSSGSGNGMTAKTCGNNPGPSVSATTESYTPGTPGYTPNGTCTSELQSNTTIVCGFVVTVTATAKMPSLIPALFGASRIVTVTAAAANPFINFAKVFSGTTIASGAKYANSVWVYPLLLNANGQPDYAANVGALPDNTTCLAGNGPDATTCGAGTPQTGTVSTGYTAASTGTVNYVMLANTEYANSQLGAGTFTSPISGITYVGGVVQNPPTPAGITATSPLGVGFQGIAGGNLFYNSATELSAPGLYGYDVVSLGANPPQYVTAQYNGCAFPYDRLVYDTMTQVWQTTLNAHGANTISPLLPWGLVTHWFYSSYLANSTPLPPSEGEIAAQTPNNETVLSVPQDPAQAGGNIAGAPTYNAAALQQSPPAAANLPVTAIASHCPATSNVGGVLYSNNISQTTTYPASSATNCSLFIAQSTTPGTPTPAPAQYDGACFQPSATPGAQYAAQSCQSYGNYYYFFYWNDMGGAQYDNINYEPDANSYTTSYGIGEGPQANGDGTVVLHCADSSHIVLIQ